MFWYFRGSANLDEVHATVSRPTIPLKQETIKVTIEYGNGENELGRVLYLGVSRGTRGSGDVIGIVVVRFDHTRLGCSAWRLSSRTRVLGNLLRLLFGIVFVQFRSATSTVSMLE